VNPFRSVGARLSLALVVVVAGALAVVYAIVVPSLERNLVDARRSQLERAAPELAGQLVSANGTVFPLAAEEVVRTGATTLNARVAVFQAIEQFPPVLITQADSDPEDSWALERDPIALRTAQTLRPASGVVTRGGQKFAEAAVVAPGQPSVYVLLVRAPLADALANVDLVRRRLLLAGALALLASVVLGYGAASLFARRLRRLERAAERIERGEFDEPVIDRQRDEIGQVAAAFERMRDRLAQLEDARREFIANASHELRTPLFALGGFLELLADEDLDPATRAEFLATMREQVDRLTKLATDLLDLSRLDAGRLRVVAEPFDLAEVARDVTDDFAAVARSTGHPLDVTTEASVSALGDPDRVGQIGRTLVENALRHTPRGTPVRVYAGVRRDRAVLTVEDAGPGVPPDQRAQVFERFYRAEGTTASGSGLGLAIAWELAELMNGTIELASRPGRTVFALVLPLARAPVRDEALATVA
jgi:signal transduction histidine kinase